MHRRKYLVPCLLALVACFASAGTYTITQSSGGNIVGSGSDTGNHCDDCVTSINLPFTFHLYDQDFTSANITSNGVIYFGLGASDTSGNIPSNNFTYAIFPLWKDQCTDGTCGEDPLDGFGIFSSTTGAPGSQVFNLEWQTVDFSDEVTTHAYELHLYQGLTTFDVVYTDTTFPTNATIGVQKDLLDFTIFQNGVTECEVDCSDETQSLAQALVGLQAPQTQTLTFSTSQSAVPEPASLALIGLGLIAIPVVRKIRKR